MGKKENDAIASELSIYQANTKTQRKRLRKFLSKPKTLYVTEKQYQALLDHESKSE